jgi:hypothetical protein
MKNIDVSQLSNEQFRVLDEILDRNNIPIDKIMDYDIDLEKGELIKGEPEVVTEEGTNPAMGEVKEQETAQETAPETPPQDAVAEDLYRDVLKVNGKDIEVSLTSAEHRELLQRGMRHKQLDEKYRGLSNTMKEVEELGLTDKERREFVKKVLDGDKNAIAEILKNKQVDIADVFEIDAKGVIPQAKEKQYEYDIAPQAVNKIKAYPDEIITGIDRHLDTLPKRVKSALLNDELMPQLNATALDYMAEAVTHPEFEAALAIADVKLSTMSVAEKVRIENNPLLYFAFVEQVAAQNGMLNVQQPQTTPKVVTANVPQEQKPVSVDEKKVEANIRQQGATGSNREPETKVIDWANMSDEEFNRRYEEDQRRAK